MKNDEEGLSSKIKESANGEIRVIRDSSIPKFGQL
jgi:hypothetical protein